MIVVCVLEGGLLWGRLSELEKLEMEELPVSTEQGEGHDRPC